MNLSTSTSSQSHRSRARPDRTPSGPRPLSSASSRSSISSGSSNLTHQSSIDTIREKHHMAQPMLTVTPSDPPHTRRLSLVSMTSEYSTYSNATTLPSIEGSHLDFDTLSIQFDELMRQLESAPAPVVPSYPGTISRATTSASKASALEERRPATSSKSPALSQVAVASSSTLAVTGQAAAVEVPRPYLATHRRRTSSMSSTSTFGPETISTLGPETNSEHFTVSAFPQPPSSIPQRPDAAMPPTSPPRAQQSPKSLVMPDAMGHGSPKHASWTGTLLYIDSTKVTDTKELQPDLEAQHYLEKVGTRTAHDDDRKRRSIAFGFAMYFLPIFILAVITLIIFLIARYR